MKATTPAKPVVHLPYTSVLPFSDWASLNVKREAWQKNKALVEEAGSSDKELLVKAREVAKRAAAIDTGAIEGLYELDRGVTITIAAEVGYWQAAYEKETERVRSLIESQLSAYDEVIDFATGVKPLAEAWIRTLHAKICASQGKYSVQTAVGRQEHLLPLGTYKTEPNHVLRPDGKLHEYAPVDMVPVEMGKLLDELRNDAFTAAHPILQAAYSHYALVWIHPFADGNGRVARALGSVFTYRQGSIPLLILMDHRRAYFDSLLAADEGKRQPFVDFIQSRCIDAFTLVYQSLQSARLPSTVQTRKRLERLYRTTGGYTHDTVDAAGSRLFDAICAKAAELAGNYGVDVLKISPMPRVEDTPGVVPDTYRRVVTTRPRLLLIEFASVSPATAQRAVEVRVYVPKDCEEDSDFVAISTAIEPFRIPMRDIHPTLTTVGELRIAMFVDGLFGWAIDTLTTQGSNSLKSAGL